MFYKHTLLVSKYESTRLYATHVMSSLGVLSYAFTLLSLEIYTALTNISEQHKSQQA